MDQVMSGGLRTAVGMDDTTHLCLHTMPDNLRSSCPACMPSGMSSCLAVPAETWVLPPGKDSCKALRPMLQAVLSFAPLGPAGSTTAAHTA